MPNDTAAAFRVGDPTIAPGAIVSALSEDDHWGVEDATLLRSYRRHKSVWWLATKSGVEHRFTEECIYEVNGRTIA